MCRSVVELLTPGLPVPLQRQRACCGVHHTQSFQVSLLSILLCISAQLVLLASYADLLTIRFSPELDDFHPAWFLCHACWTPQLQETRPDPSIQQQRP